MLLNYLTLVLITLISPIGLFITFCLERLIAEACTVKVGSLNCERNYSMFGILKSWKMTGITTDGAKLSQPIHALGLCVANRSSYEYEFNSDKAQAIAIGKQYLEMRVFIDMYLFDNMKNQEENATKFIVMFCAFGFGYDGVTWDWTQIRHQSQGIWGSMTGDPANFVKHNIPIIDEFDRKIQKFIEELL